MILLFKKGVVSCFADVFSNYIYLIVYYLFIYGVTLKLFSHNQINTQRHEKRFLFLHNVPTP